MLRCALRVIAEKQGSSRKGSSRGRLRNIDALVPARSGARSEHGPPAPCGLWPVEFWLTGARKLAEVVLAAPQMPLPGAASHEGPKASLFGGEHRPAWVMPDIPV